MRRWWQLATRNWWARPGRALAAILSVALGVGTVTAITGFYETASRAIEDEVVKNWVGTAHISIEPPGSHWGHMNAGLLDTIEQLEGIKHATIRLKRRMFIPGTGPSLSPSKTESQTARQAEAPARTYLVQRSKTYIDAIGIDPDREMYFRAFPALKGRTFKSGERGLVLIEDKMADELGLALGDSVNIAVYSEDNVAAFEIVGIFESQRMAEFQQPSVFMPIEDVQKICAQPDNATIIDLMLEDTSSESVTAMRERIQALIDELGLYHRVQSSEARQELLNQADRLTQTVIILIAFIAMLTSFFIILTTMSVSLFERRAIFGMMRCVGVTKRLLAGLLLLEILPLGIIGTVLGLIGGVLAMEFIVSRPDVHVTAVYFSAWGLSLAAIGGIITTLLASSTLMCQVFRVTPLAAATPEARPARMLWIILATIAGFLSLACHEYMMHHASDINWFSLVPSAVATLTLYLGYALIAPAVVVLIARPISRLIGRLLALNGKLAEDQFGRAPWRSAGICWMLMVGLSLIVYFTVRLEGVYAIWSFPARLPDVFIWTGYYAGEDKVEKVRNTPGIVSVSAMTDLECEIIDSVSKKGKSAGRLAMERILRSFTRPVYVAGDPDEVIPMMKLTFTEGDSEEALEKAKRGGHVLIPVQASRQHDLHVGDKVTLKIKGKQATFEVSGVVESPAMDVAATFFSADSYMQFAAASAFFGTREDLIEKFGIDDASMFLCNLDIPRSDPPEVFQKPTMIDTSDRYALIEALLTFASELTNEQHRLQPVFSEISEWAEALLSHRKAVRAGRSAETIQSVPAALKLSYDAEMELNRYAAAFNYISRHWAKWEPQQRWNVFRERLILDRASAHLDSPQVITGSVARLRAAVDRSLRRAMAILTWIPSLGLFVAAIGIGNLMMVSVRSRARSLAILRSVGAQKSQILRLVLAEAATLGVLGSMMGVGLGLHLARSDEILNRAIAGVSMEFLVPYETLTLAIALTIAVCVLSGLLPARQASRNNIVEALQNA